MSLLKRTSDKGRSDFENKAINVDRISRFLSSLLRKDDYIAKSEYLDFVKDNQLFVDELNAIDKNGLLKHFCMIKGISFDDVNFALKDFNSIADLVDKHNDDYLKRKLETEKEYLDNVLKGVDPVICLDNDQRKVVLSDEDYTLVIAGAGAGKTTTVAAKVKYLVDKKGVDPKQILVVSFTNKAVGELREKINDGLGINCPITTFHSAGNAIIYKNNPEKLNIVDQSRMYYVIQDYFKGDVLADEKMVNNLINFFASYFDAPYDGDDLNEFFNKIVKGNYSTMRSDLDEYKEEIIDRQRKQLRTIQNEVVRSNEEVVIANFLYLNGLDYKYEPVYKYHMEFSKKPYTPDFLIKQKEQEVYLEHFGISEDGKNNRYTASELLLYKKAINDKVMIHQKHGTELIYTFSSFNDRRDLISHLKDLLIKEGFKLQPRNKKEVLQKLINLEADRYIRRLISLITRFIGSFKTNNYSLEDFDRMYSSTTNVRSRLFLNITKQCYLEYERYLRENKLVDFEDLINESARILSTKKEMEEKLDFKYIIVDEYQDISMQRYDLVSALSEVTDAKIIAVGDDWQSIYAFSGSDLALFTDFERKMGHALKLKIVNTYRNSQEVIDIAGGFIQKNEAQIKKDLKSPKNITDPVVIRTYDNSKKSDGANYNLAKAVETCIGNIVEYDKKEGKNTKSVLLLGRFGFDGDKLVWTGLFQGDRYKGRFKCIKYPEIDITFMTAHASKGLGYDNVIIINGKNETYGFPSKIEDDPVLAFVIKGDRCIDYAEERRLFYVAMTRTKNRVFIVAPEKNPSEFLIEIKKDYDNVKLIGDWNENYVPENNIRNKCPVCGYPLAYKYKNAYGLRLYICTNEPELCGFMSNDLKGGKLSICKCDKCVDGYLIVKKSSKSDAYFLGCTNFSSDGKGCDNVMSKKTFFSINGIVEEVNDENRIILNKNIEKLERKENSNGLESYTQQVIVDNKHETIATSLEPLSKKKENFFSVEDENEKLIYDFSSTPIGGTVLCDNCDLYLTVAKVLTGLNELNKVKAFSIYVLCDFLKGMKSEIILKNKLEALELFGILNDFELGHMYNMVCWLIKEGYISQTKQNYPVLYIGYKTQAFREYLTHKKLLELRRYIINGE